MFLEHREGRSRMAVLKHSTRKIFLDLYASISTQGNMTSTRKIFLKLSGFAPLPDRSAEPEKMFLDPKPDPAVQRSEKCS